MWERPRPVRTEIISVDTERLAKHAFAKSEFTCLRALPAADGKTLLTVTAAGDWDGTTRNYWFRNNSAATSVLRRIVEGLNRSLGWRVARARAHRKGSTLEAIPYVASDTEGGVLVEADDANAVIEECLKWWPVHIVTETEVRAYIANIKADIDRSLVRWQATGEMKALNRRYKELRTSPRAPGEKFPSLKAWLTAQFEARMLQQPAPADL